MLTDLEDLKLLLLAEGIHVERTALDYLREQDTTGTLTPADYASTSGVILRLGEDVWVNAPFVDHNPNFVESPTCVLTLDDGHLVVRGDGVEAAAKFWLPPRYHVEANKWGEPYTSYAFTHTDRVRISPIEGCSMACQFCNLPYDFRYRSKRVEGLLDAVQAAVDDPVQPASHVLISGGTPREGDFDYVRDAYDAVLERFGHLGVDVMMVPMEEVVDVERLVANGVDGLSINVEIYNQDIARRIMRRKWIQGIEQYLSFIERAASVMEPNRCRSMLMVGLEPLEDTLAGVQAIAERGGVPVLSPFRPDPATPLRRRAQPSRDELREAYLRSRDITEGLGVPLGPRCIPCSHNTLSFADTGSGDASHHYGVPATV
jgi:hypothetical protein